MFHLHVEIPLRQSPRKRGVSGGGPLEEMMNSLDVLAKVATDKLEKEPKVVIKTEGVKEPKMATKSEGLKEDFSEDDSTPLKKVFFVNLKKNVYLCIAVKVFYIVSFIS